MIAPFRWIARQFSGKKAASDRGANQHEAADTNRENRDHWKNADETTNAQITPEKRRTLRTRGKYEATNNCYVQGLVRTLVRDTIGMGPRLQMLTDDDKLNEGVEELWRRWTAATNMPLKFRIMSGMGVVAGECFGVFYDSPKLSRLGLPVSLNVRLIDPAQVTDGITQSISRTTGDEGVDVDEEGDPAAYHILKQHPGERFLWNLEPDRVPAANVLHWYRPDAPGQLRGVTPLAPALDIFGQLRRCKRATCTAFEFAASIAGVLESDLPVDGDSPVTQKQYWQAMDIVRGMLLTLPSGVKAKPFEQKHPTTQYEMFINLGLREAGRMLNVPFGKMTGDHSGYNYSSGRMDDAPYWSDRDVERQEFEVTTIDPVFYLFCDFARFALPQLAAFKGRFWELKHTWHYDARPSADPVKDATGDELNLTNCSDDLHGIAARDGTTAEALIKQRRRTLDLFTKYDVPPPPWATGAHAPARQEPGEPTPQTQEFANA